MRHRGNFGAQASHLRDLRVCSLRQCGFKLGIKLCLVPLGELFHGLSRARSLHLQLAFFKLKLVNPGRPYAHLLLVLRPNFAQLHAVRTLGRRQRRPRLVQLGTHRLARLLKLHVQVALGLRRLHLGGVCSVLQFQLQLAQFLLLRDGGCVQSFVRRLECRRLRFEQLRS